jgi:hypothetical protein
MDDIYFENQAKKVDNMKDYYKYNVGDRVYITIRVLGAITTNKSVFKNKDEAMEEKPPRHGYIGVLKGEVKNKYTSSEMLSMENIELIKIKEGKRV